MSTNLLIIVGNGSDEQNPADFDQLAAALAQQLNVPTLTAYLDASPSISEALRQGINAHQPRRVVVQPLLVGTSAAKKNNLRLTIESARELYPDVGLHYAPELGSHSGVIAAYRVLIEAAIQAAAQPIVPADTALIVVGRGSRDPESNADVYMLARRLWEEVKFGSLEVAYHRLTKPDLAAAINRCLQIGARRIVISPYMLYERSVYETILKQARQLQPLIVDSGAELLITDHLNDDAGMVAAITARYQGALAQLSQTLREFFPFTETELAEIHQFAPHAHAGAFDLQSLLPPRYQGEVQVSAAPMSAADLIFDADGQVAWDQIWGSFCDLALAGGPPHRGSLLEPAAPESATADPIGYRRVIVELERGITMITGLPVITDKYLGWIGVQCTDEEMALWLLRAIVVENISVRREDAILYLPAGAHFRLEKEIKNVITVLAKTHHYWTEHLASKAKVG
ncbi:MAG: sirohydrochlorin chelatase [Anaerolineae bacterium]|nr:sirohydrochlorin chelatase [Anaerolineae bacterium]